jgi:hypothetical protein
MSKGCGTLRSKSAVLRPLSTSPSCTFRLRYTRCLPRSYSPMWPITLRDILFSCPLLPFSLHILVKYLTLDHPSRCPVSFTVCSVLVVNFKLLSKVISVLSRDFLRSTCWGYDVVEHRGATNKEGKLRRKADEKLDGRR